MRNWRSLLFSLRTLCLARCRNIHNIMIGQSTLSDVWRTLPRNGKVKGKGSWGRLNTVGLRTRNSLRSGRHERYCDVINESYCNQLKGIHWFDNGFGYDIPLTMELLHSRILSYSGIMIKGNEIASMAKLFHWIRDGYNEVFCGYVIAEISASTYASLSSCHMLQGRASGPGFVYGIIWTEIWIRVKWYWCMITTGSRLLRVSFI